MTRARRAPDGRRRLAALLALATGVSVPTLALAGSATATVAASYSAATIATGLASPSSIAIAANGDVYVADTGHHVIIKISSGTPTVFAGTSGTSGPPTAGSATATTLSSPRGVAVDAAGNVYIADTGNNLVEKVTSAGTLSIIAGTPSTPGAAGVALPAAPGPAASSPLSAPSGVAVDAAGKIFIADRGNNQVEMIQGATLSIVAGTGLSGAATAGPATASTLSAPTAVAVDASGSLYVADTGNNTVDKVITPTTAPTLSVVASGLAGPTGVAVDASGTVWIADGGNHRIASATGGTVTAVPTTGTALSTPAGIALGANGLVDVADAGSNSALALTPTGSSTAPHLTSAAPTIAAKGQPLSLTVTVSGFPIPTLSEIGTLPAGLTFDPSTGILAGTPTALGSTTFTLRATNNQGHEDQVVTLTVGDVPGAPTTPTATRGAGSAALTWKAPAVTTEPLTGFVITPMIGTTAGKPVTVSASATSATITGLTAGSAYTFTIAASNKFGTGATVSTTTAVTPYGGPVAPGPGIHRFDGTGRIATAVGVSQALFPNPGSAQVVVVASSANYADALAGARLASAESAPLLLTSGSTLNPAVAGEVSRLLGSTGTVFVLGGTTTISDTVASALKALNAGFTVTRLAGPDRYATATVIATQIAKDTGVSDDAPIYLASGVNYPDGLAVSALAARTGGVVLLTNGATMPKATADFLAANNSDGTRAVPVGGPAVAAAVTAGGRSAAARAINGANRYETSRLVAARFAGTGAPTTPVPSVGLATGANWPDALVGAAAMGDLGGPLLLTPGDHLDPSVTSAMTALSKPGRPTASLVFGGSDTVSDATSASFGGLFKTS